jgi:pyruvate dehydrogenase E2 component (dihydrolipoamide acetyltransferase)
VAAVEFRLPDVGEGIATAEIVDWRVAAGDHVREGQDLVEVQTDKAIVVIPCPTAGVVTRLGAPAGETLDVGAVLAVFESDVAQRAPADSGSAAAGPGDGAGTAGPGNGAGAAPAPAPERRSLAAPATRRLARELGIDLAQVRGSGPRGRILREDLESASSGISAPSPASGISDPSPASAAPPPASAAPPPASAAPSPASGAGAVSGAAAVPAPGPRAADPRPGQTVPLRGVRRAIARTLTRAWQEIPHVIDYREVDATNLIRFRQVLKQRASERGDTALARAMTPTPLIIRAAAKALRENPYVNSSIDLERGEITLHEQVNIGVATATPDGLMVPVLHDADRKSISEIAVEVAELVADARERRLAPGQLAGGTFTVNNYGGLGIWLGTPIIRPPEVANLGVGAIRDQVVPVDGVPAVRPILVLAVSGDHRVLDADNLAAFVTQVVGLLEEPLLLLEDLR